jgi:pimeloyl-ACP methyl ester carboxylesterase
MVPEYSSDSEASATEANVRGASIAVITQKEGVHLLPTRIGTLHVRVIGHGPVAVLWHSLFIDSRNWCRVEEALAQQRTLVMIDGPSHGGSEPARRLFTLADCAAAAEEVLGQLGMATPVDWVGNAWGGHVGIVFAAERPERTRSLVMLASPVHALRPAERRRSALLVGLYRILGAHRFLRAAVLDAMLTPAVRKARPRTAELITDVLRHADRQGFVVTMRSIMLSRPDLTRLLPRITAPTVVVAGGDDAMWTAGSAAAAAGHLPHGQAATIPGTRHLPPLEAPDEVIGLVTRAWAAASDATPTR